MFNLDWYDYLFIVILMQFAIFWIGGLVAAVIYAYNIAVFIVKAALGRLENDTE